MRVLALDHGGARCGAALSDPTGTIVTPITAITRPDSRRGLSTIAALVAEHDVRLVVVGLPLGLSGADTEQTRAARAFAAALQRRLGPKVPVELYDERFTTRLAQRTAQETGGAQAEEDSLAAAHLLEGWLAASGSAGR